VEISWYVHTILTPYHLLISLMNLCIQRRRNLLSYRHIHRHRDGRICRAGLKNIAARADRQVGGEVGELDQSLTRNGDFSRIAIRVARWLLCLRPRLEYDRLLLTGPS
jgi:hypothetical protein